MAVSCQHTLISLRVCDGQVEVCRLAQLFLFDNSVLEVGDGDGAGVKDHCVIVFGALKLIIHSHLTKGNDYEQCLQDV